MRTALRIGILCCVGAFGLVIAFLAAPREPSAAALDFAVGIVFLVVAAAAWSRAEALLGAAASFTWFIAGLDPFLFAAFWHRGVVAHLIVHIAWRGRLPASARLVVALSYVLAVTWPVWTYDTIAVWVALAWGAAVLTVVALAARSRRRTLALWAGSLLIAGTLASAAVRLTAGKDAATGVADAVYGLGLVIAGVLLVVAVRAPALDSLVDAVVRLGERGSEVRDQLAGLLGDPTLEIAYWDEPHRAYRREDGGEVAEGRDTRRVDLDGERAALLVHRGAAIDEALLDRAVLGAVRIRREHDRLLREAHSRLIAVSDARRRIAVADALERARFGRELNQTVLVPLAALTKAVRDERARELLSLATDDLRVLASGLAPESLSGGLPSALRLIASTAPVPVEVLVDDPLPEPDPATAACLYFVCAEGVANAVHHGLPDGVMVELRATDRFELSVRNRVGGTRSKPEGSGLQGLRDRVEALGGSLEAGAIGDGFRLVASLPLSASSGDLGERAALEEHLYEGIRPGT